MGLNNNVKFRNSKILPKSYSLDSKISKEENDDSTEYKLEIAWFTVVKLATLHAGAIMSLGLIPFAHNYTILFSYLMTMLTVLGIQVGAHRLWAHRSYQANFGVRLFLALCQTTSLQNDIYEWVRDHRVHHKWSDTNADPHNASRGFFFSHMGWLMVRKHPEVIRKGSTLDLSDLEADPIVMWQRKLYQPLLIVFWGLVPTFIPVLLWKESVIISFYISVLLRYTVTLHVTWSVNSWAHAFGTKPYNKGYVPVEASIRHVMMGEGFHNYHHQFPNDYSASELGPLDVFNPATAVIDLLAYMGWAWDLKKPDKALVERTIQATGDAAVGYKKTRFLFAREWLWGLLVMTAPVWGQFVLKYTVLHFYYMFFDSPIDLSIASLYSQANKQIRVHI